LVQASMRETECKYDFYNPAAKYTKYRRIIVDWMVSFPVCLGILAAPSLTLGCG
jgi:hypothetical protein